MEAFDDVGGVHDAANVLVEFEVGAQSRPIAFPRFDDLWISRSPIGGEPIEIPLGLFYGSGFVDALQVFDEGFDSLVREVLDGIVDLMDHAELHLCFGEDRLYRFCKSSEVVNAGDEQVAQSSVRQIGENTQPELRTFRLADVESEEFLAPVLIEPDDAVDRSRNYAALVTHFVANGIEQDKRIDGLQRSCTPVGNQWQNLVRDTRYGGYRGLQTVDVHQMITDITVARTTCVQGDDLLV